MTMQPPSTGPQPPTGLTVAVTGDGTAVVSWDAQQSRVCDVVIRNYSVRYQLRGGTGCHQYSVLIKCQCYTAGVYHMVKSTLCQWLPSTLKER